MCQRPSPRSARPIRSWPRRRSGLRNKLPARCRQRRYRVGLGDDMAFTVLGLTARGIVAAALSLSLIITLGAGGAAAQDKTYVMKIGTPTVNDTPENFVRLFGP